MAAQVSLSSQQLEGLDALIARGKDILVDELPGGPLGPKCWLDTGVQVAIVVTMVAGCAGVAYTATPAPSGGAAFTIEQLKDLRYRATEK
jgi:hypothetical protein